MDVLRECQEGEVVRRVYERQWKAGSGEEMWIKSYSCEGER